MTQQNSSEHDDLLKGQAYITVKAEWIDGKWMVLGLDKIDPEYGQLHRLFAPSVIYQSPSAQPQQNMGSVAQLDRAECGALKTHRVDGSSPSASQPHECIVNTHGKSWTQVVFDYMEKERIACNIQEYYIELVYCALKQSGYLTTQPQPKAMTEDEAVEIMAQKWLKTPQAQDYIYESMRSIYRALIAAQAGEGD